MTGKSRGKETQVEFSQACSQLTSFVSWTCVCLLLEGEDLQSLLKGEHMTFKAEEREILLAVKGIGPTVIKRLEDMGFSSLDALAHAEMQDVVAHGAAMLGSSCWKNSPQSRAAIDGAITAARRAIANR
jgi:nucleotidyltransferase/DNA polymerase involved in DNA repair